MSIISSMDQGIFTSAISSIKLDFELSDNEFGLLSSTFYLGKLVGSGIFIFLIKQSNRKYLLTFSLVIISLSSYIIATFKQFWILCISRFLFGLFQTYFLTYIPLWCEQFIFQKTKIVMITLIQLSVPMGVVIGYLTAIALDWKNSIYIEIIGNCFTCFLLLFFNEKYFSLDVFSTYNQKNSSFRSKTTVYSIFNSKIGNSSSSIKSEGVDDEENYLVCSAFTKIFKNKSLFFSLLARALSVLPLTVLHTWLNDYELNVLEFDLKDRIISFCLICTLSPTIGTIMGGMLGSTLDSLDSKFYLLLAFILYGISYISAFFISQFESVWLFTLILCISVCFSASIIPILTRFIISSVSVKLRNSIGSITVLLSILLGHIPGPFLYGLIYSHGINQQNPKLAMKSISYFIIIPLVFLFFSVIIKCFEKKAENSEKNTFTKNNMEPLSNKKKKSTLFTTSIAGIYGNHLEIENDIQFIEEKDFDDSDDISSRNNSNNAIMNSILSGNGFYSQKQSNASDNNNSKTNSSHYTADIKE